MRGACLLGIEAKYAGIWYLWAASLLLRGEKLLVLALNVGRVGDLSMCLGHGKGLRVDKK